MKHLKLLKEYSSQTVIEDEIKYILFDLCEKYEFEYDMKKDDRGTDCFEIRFSGSILITSIEEFKSDMSRFTRKISAIEGAIPEWLILVIIVNGIHCRFGDQFYKPNVEMLHNYLDTVTFATMTAFTFRVSY